MNINRTNYEEYFLLYADKELPAYESRNVEFFVEMNPDLEEEFYMIRQSLLVPDSEIMLEDKSKLYRSPGFIIHSFNLDKLIIAYHDNELSSLQRDQLEEYISGENLQQRFLQLKVLKAIPNPSVRFPDKRLLYRTESSFKVNVFSWRVAAVLLVSLCAWLVLKLTQPDQNTTSALSMAEVRLAYPLYDQTLLTAKSSVDLVPKVPTGNLLKKMIQPQISSTLLKNDPTHKYTSTSLNSTIHDQAKVANTLNLALHGTDVQIKVESSQQLISKPMINLITSSEKIIQDNGSLLSINNAAIFQAKLKENKPDPKNENYVFYNITEEQFQKSKLGGFLRKVKKAIERKNPLNHIKPPMPVNPGE